MEEDVERDGGYAILQACVTYYSNRPHQRVIYSIDSQWGVVLP